MFDIDDFGHLNRVWGHQRGDELLEAVAEQIAAHGGVQDARCTASAATSSRCCCWRPRSETGTRLRTAHPWPESLRLPLLPTTSVSLSAGIAFYPRHGADVDQVLAHALAAQQLARATE